MLLVQTAWLGSFSPQTAVTGESARGDAETEDLYHLPVGITQSPLKGIMELITEGVWGEYTESIVDRLMKACYYISGISMDE